MDMDINEKARGLAPGFGLFGGFSCSANVRHCSKTDSAGTTAVLVQQHAQGREQTDIKLYICINLRAESQQVPTADLKESTGRSAAVAPARCRRERRRSAP